MRRKTPETRSGRPRVQSERHSVSAFRALLTIARYIWASPCSALGLVLAVPILLLGGTLHVRSGVLQAALSRTARRSRLPFSAITFGHVVLGQSEEALHHLSAHELAHVRQYERWGLLFFVAYPLSSLVQLLRGRDPYWFNHFEVQARFESAGPPRGSSPGV